MRALGRLLRLLTPALLLVPTLHADTLADLARRYARDYAMSARVHARIPSFSRQTGLACSACHTAFPMLTAFGRNFKLNGYTLTGMQTIQSGDSSKPSLKLDAIPPLSAMFLSSFTQMKKKQPGTQNGNVDFPQELSLFFGEAITPRLGAFLQITYDPREGGIGMDNADIRYADHTHLGSKVLGYGFTLNNNPTVQDVWNSTPAWGFPYASSEVSLTPAAGTILDGALGQQAAGLGAYALLDNHFYGEFSVYRSAAQGGPNPPDATSEATIHGVGPYWRAFYQQSWGSQTIMVGTLGMNTSFYPEGVSGLRNRFTQIGFDAQYERGVGGGNLTAHAIWIREKEHLAADLDAGTAANQDNTLKTLRVDASAYSARRIGLTLGFFNTTGTTDALRYPADALTGSANGSPNSTGFIGEISLLPWLNTRFEIQYVGYAKFNGAKTNYDGFGRNASDNNTLYLLSWVAF